MRGQPSAHSAIVAGSSTDYLALWRCDESTGAFDDFIDALAGSPRQLAAGGGGAAEIPSLFNSDPTIGARDFNGVDSCGVRTISDADHTLFQGLAWGVAAWVRVDTLGAKSILEYGEWSSPETQATNIQLGMQVTAGGSMRMLWENGAGVNVITDITSQLAAGNLYHLGWACEPDPDAHGKARLRAYKNGVCVGIVAGIAPMDGGTTSKWILGASWNAGTGVGSPGGFFDGAIDDVVVTRFSPSHEWFREVYARGVRDFAIRMGKDGNTPTEAVLCETYVRVLVEVGTGEFLAFDDKVNLTDLDLSSINGIDFLQEVEWGENVDDAGASARVALMPRFGFYNMSPFVPSAGSLNDNPLDGLWTKPRRIKIETATVPCGTCRENVGPNWWLVFDGWTLAVDVGADAVTATCIDRIGPLQDVWIQSNPDGTDRKFGTVGGQAIETVLQNIVDQCDPARYDILNVDDTGGGGKLDVRVLDTAVQNGNGRPHLFLTGDSIKIEDTTNFNGVYTVDAGTADTFVRTQEAHGAAAGETSGTLRATQSLSYLGGKPTIFVPATPSFNLFERYETSSKNVAQALEDLVDYIGWRIVFRWDDTRQEMRLKLYDPRNAFGGTSRCADNINAPDLAVHRDDQRDVGVVEYASNANKDNVGERTCRIVTAKDANQRSGGYRAFRFSVGADSLVTDSTAAQKLVDVLVGDLKRASAEGGFDCPYDVFLEVHDELVLNSEVLTATQMATAFGDQVVGAIADLRHRFSRGAVRTTVKPRRITLGSSLDFSVARARRHLELINLSGRLPGIGRSPVPTPAAPTVASLGAVGASRMISVKWTIPAGDLARKYKWTEVHVHDNTGAAGGYTPSSATLLVTVAGSTVVATHAIVGGQLGHVKIIHRDDMGNTTAASAVTTFTS